MSPKRTTKEPKLPPTSALAPIVQQLNAMIAGMAVAILPDGDADARSFAAGRREGLETAVTLLTRAGALHVVTDEGQRLVKLERAAPARDEIGLLDKRIDVLANRMHNVEGLVQALMEINAGVTRDWKASKPMPEILKSPGDEKKLTKCARELLGVLAQRQNQATSLIQLSILSGYSITSSSFEVAVRALRSHRFAVGSREDIRVTPEGQKEAGDVARLPAGGSPALLDYWCSKIGTAEGTILRAVVEAKADGFNGGIALAKATGYSPTSSSFDGAIRKLRNLQLVTRHWPMLAAAIFFAPDRGRS